jgi:hypothetical protein
MRTANALGEALGSKNVLPTVTVYRLFKLVGQLLGYDYQDGKQYRTPHYSRTPSQYFEAHLHQGGDMEDFFRNKENAISVRREIVQELKQRGVSDFNVSLVLNTSEYEVRNLRRKS